MGFAQGKMLKDEINNIIPAFFQHVENEVENEITFLPKELQELIAKYGLDGALDITYELTKKHIPKYFLEELQGVADGAAIDYKLLLRVHMLPELVKVSQPLCMYSKLAMIYLSSQAGCSMLGAWGSALSDPSGMIQVSIIITCTFTF